MATFESLVNLEGCKTKSSFRLSACLFESLVNLEGCKTIMRMMERKFRLRVLLI